MPYWFLLFLFETNQHELAQHTLLVDTSEDIQIMRACARDQQSEEQIRQIIAAQMPRSQNRLSLMIL